MKRKSGFTLIELLVVIAIIAILAAILFPVFAQAREKARQISCTSNMKQIGLAILQYQQDYDEAYPSSDWWNVPGGTSPVGWPTRVQPYIKNLAVFGCPDDPSALKPDAVNSWAGAMLSYAGNGFRTGWNAATSQAQPGGPFSFDAGTT